VTSEDDYLLRKIFDRVNSAGKPIGRTDIFHALFASETEPGSPDTVVESLAKRLRFGRLDPQRILQSLLALRGGNVQRDLHDEFAASESAAEWYDRTEEALHSAISFLKHQGIPHLGLVPSTLPIPVLAAFFYLHPDPEPWTRRLISRWLWRGWVNGFGNRGQTPALRQAIYYVNPKKGAPDKAPAEDEAALNLLSTVSSSSDYRIRLAPFRTESAATRLALLALATLRPLKLDGSPVEIAEEFEKFGVGAVTEVIRSRRGELGARGFWPTNQKPPTGHERSDILASHGIDDELAYLLREGRLDEFTNRRGAFIESLTRNYVDAHIEENALDRPSLSSLIIPDEDVEGENDE
jgi:hypothetical protein